MQNLLKIMDFGNEAGDDADVEELVNYFVEQNAFSRFLENSRRISIATAKKGVGKSALLQWIAYTVAKRDPSAIVIKCRGADLVRSKFKRSVELKTPNDYIHDWTVRICTLINREIARRINFAFSDDSISLVEAAEIDGYKSRNLVSCLFKRFEKMIGADSPSKIGISDEYELLKRNAERNVWVVIDDLDATYQNTKEESLELATFFSACRYISQDVKGICVRATMRTDVWALLRRYDESLDKMEQYVVDILWHQDDFLRLLFLRIKAQLEKNGESVVVPLGKKGISESEEEYLDRIFVRKMQWGDKNVSTYKVLYTVSYERPRWAIQLCKLAQSAALQHQHTHIQKEDIDSIWGGYGAQRISDLVAEHKHQCPQIQELINGFRGCERLMTRDNLLKWVKTHISNHLAPVIEGEENRSEREIAHFLYRLGFIMARSDSDDGYEHYSFSQMPDFLTSRTDSDFNLKWEIHPCYREALDIKKLDKSHRDKFSGLRKRSR